MPFEGRASQKRRNGPLSGTRAGPGRKSPFALRGHPGFVFDGRATSRTRVVPPRAFGHFARQTVISDPPPNLRHHLKTPFVEKLPNFYSEMLHCTRNL
jgi:hypothetical protein